MKRIGLAIVMAAALGAGTTLTAPAQAAGLSAQLGVAANEFNNIEQAQYIYGGGGLTAGIPSAGMAPAGTGVVTPRVLASAGAAQLAGVVGTGAVADIGAAVDTGTTTTDAC